MSCLLYTINCSSHKYEKYDWKRNIYLHFHGNGYRINNCNSVNAAKATDLSSVVSQIGNISLSKINIR